MPSYRYLHLDVFTDRPFEGNQLAVFTDPQDVRPVVMQKMAREMNFSESTFLLPADRPDTTLRMRIFTPGAELPMAGHPTIGSTFALAFDGRISPGDTHVVFGLGVGPTRVELEWQDGQLAFAWMDQRPPDARTPASPSADIVRAAGIDPAAHERTGLPIQEISCGNPFILVPVDSRAAVDAAVPDLTALRGLTSAFSSKHIGVFLFTTDGGDSDVTAYSRMFAPSLGVPEDPATGSASGPLGCYLVAHGLVAPERRRQIVSLQGVAMGRPSRISIAVDADGAKNVSRVQVGGQAIVLGEGTLAF